LILSGPAGGVLGAAWFSKMTDLQNLITIDMGGTSLDASLIVDGEPLTHVDASFESLPINLPSLYIHTIGAGGGSKVWVDEGGALQVGPASAGADPGPAAYGRGGTDATFTDAAMQTGYLAGDVPLAGTLSLDAGLAADALRPAAEQLGLSLDELALGVVRISVTKIVGAVRAITVELGHDPSDFALLTFGGGGGLVAVDVARELSIPTVVVPPGPGAFCAFGMLMAHVQHDAARTRIGPLEEIDLSTAQADLDEMRAETDQALEAEGFAPAAREFTFAADLRYAGQEHSVSLPIPEKLTADQVERISESFATAHARQYGHTMPDPVELTALRVTAVGRSEPATLPELDPRTDGSTPQPHGTRQVHRPSGQSLDYGLYLRDDLTAGDRVTGPAIIAEHTATTVLHGGDTAEIGSYGELVITVGNRANREA
jgi:N-methylhydantoinase A